MTMAEGFGTRVFGPQLTSTGGPGTLVEDPETPGGTAPDYSAYVTRQSLGWAGSNNQTKIGSFPAISIVRLDCQANSVCNYGELTGAETAGSTSWAITVNSATYAPPGTPYTAHIDDEKVTVTGQSGSGSARTLTVTRGVLGTTAAAHSAGAGVTSYNWSSVDSRVKACLDANKEVCLLVTYNSRDYSGWTDDKFVPTKASAAHSDLRGHTFDQWKAWWAKYFAKACVQRFSNSGNANPTSGVLSGLITGSYQVRFYEIYNEWNNQMFWDPNGSGAYNTYGSNQAYDYADLMAATYDQMKITTTQLYVGTGGTAVLPTGTGARGTKSWEAYGKCLARWDANGYTKATFGWADVPADMVIHHAYINVARFGALNSSQAPSAVDANQIYNSCFTDPPMIHNLFNAAGFGSLLIWSTESDQAWWEDAMDNYGFRGYGKPTPGYNQADADRDIYSNQEAYNAFRDTYRKWMGNIGGTNYSWPTGTGAGYTQIFDYGSPQLGPRFHFAGAEDFQTYPYRTAPANKIDHYGMWHHADEGGTTKAVGGSNNDPHDWFLSLTKRP